MPILLRHNEPILGVIRPVVRAGKSIASDSEVVKLEGFFILQANFLQYPSRGIIVYQGCRHDTLQLEVLKAAGAEVDCNVVTTGSGRLVEVQGTAEGEPFARGDLDALLDLAESGIKQLTQIQRDVLG